MGSLPSGWDALVLGIDRARAVEMSQGVAISATDPVFFGSNQRRIVVCLDRSAVSEACVPHAMALSKAFGSALTLVHVMQPQHDSAGLQNCDALGWEISMQEARNYLEQIEKQVKQTTGQSVDTRLEQGRPAMRIADLARELDAEVTVLGCHSEGSAHEQSLGSTAQQVLASSRSSVLVVHASKSDRVASGPKHILVPLDGSLRTESVLPVAARLATAHGAELLLFHVVQDPLPSGLLAAIEDLELARALAARLEMSSKRYLERLRKQLSRDVEHVRWLVVRHPNERQCLLEVARQEGTDLIILSAHGAACDSDSTFGSVTTYVLTHSSVPVLALQDLPRKAHAAQGIDPALAQPSPRASYAPDHV